MSSSFPALAHVALTVSDLDRSRAWYTRLFGSDPVLDEDTGPYRHAAWLLGNGTLFAIHQHASPRSTEPFDERRPGLDHVAFGVGSRREVEGWVTKLHELGATNGGIVDAPYGSALAFRDPDNNALEFFAPPAQASQPSMTE
jgi:glyoxylase I family protein